MKKAPVLFVSHGAPTFALEPGILGPRLAALGKELSGVEAVLVVSPHWQTPGVSVSTTAAPETIHDFGGFPRPLYALQYPAPGHPALAREAARLLTEAGLEATVDERRGLDHGAWVPMMHLLPEAGVPVFQVSLPFDLDTAAALRMGRVLAPLRERGVLILGSGSMTHNLSEFRQHVSDAPYAQAFADWVKEAVMAGKVDAMLDYRRRAPAAVRAHPTDEHFLPLLVAMGAVARDDEVEFLAGGMTYGMLSMDSFAWENPSVPVGP